ncbi:hypothetical protein [Streptosporangium sp. NPDC003464]
MIWELDLLERILVIHQHLVAAFSSITPVGLQVFGLTDEEAACQWLVRD